MFVRVGNSCLTLPFDIYSYLTLVGQARFGGLFFVLSKGTRCPES